jgi:DNA ligase-associated metallophosphoesterase
MRPAEINLEGTALQLLPDRAILLKKSRTLIVADVHWGKTATLRAASIPIPPGSTSDDLARLSGLIARTRASRLVVLGDLVHSKTWKAEQTHAAIVRWRAQHAALPITLVRGNHDIRSGDLGTELGIESCNEPLELEGFQLCHRPGEQEGYALAGHVHPCFTLYGPGRQRERLPCFLFGQRIALIPAFGSFTGMAPIQPAPGDRLFVIAGDEVVPVESSHV